MENKETEQKLDDQKPSHEKIFDILVNQEDITWQTIIYDLVKSEEMDPWDINVSLLTKKYIDTIKNLKKLDFRLSGKVLLAAALLLKIKSNRLVGEDLNHLDRLFAANEEEDEFGDFEDSLQQQEYDTPPGLYPRTPQPRKRKISIYDLVGALDKALEVKKRRVLQNMPEATIEIPKRNFDITKLIKGVYGRIMAFFSKVNDQKLFFSKILPSDSRDDKVATFLPLLHLTTTGKIDLHQQDHFGDIEITLENQEKAQENPKETKEQQQTEADNDQPSEEAAA